jgi:polar amino acid transport system substrate-binding protein
MSLLVRLLCIVSLLCGLPLQAAKPIRMGLHLSAPWSFYTAAGEVDGIEYQLVSRIFNRAGYQVEYELHSYSRLLKQFSIQKLDCASPVAIAVEGAFYTEAYLPFQDVAISLSQSGLNIDSLSGLQDKSIVAYQQAKQVLGADFRAAIFNSRYLELAERELQLELLFKQRVDLVIGERRVLHYLAAKIAPQLKLATHYLFAEQAYPAACWQAELTAVFNQGLVQLQQSGELAQILSQYSNGADMGTEWPETAK